MCVDVLGDVCSCARANAEASAPQVPGTCSPEQFACGSGECLHQEWLCDGWIDCADGTDEHSCENTTYPPFSEQCPTLPCHSAYAVSSLIIQDITATLHKT